MLTAAQRKATNDLADYLRNLNMKIERVDLDYSDDAEVMTMIKVAGGGLVLCFDRQCIIVFNPTNTYRGSMAVHEEASLVPSLKKMKLL